MTEVLRRFQSWCFPGLCDIKILSTQKEIQKHARTNPRQKKCQRALSVSTNYKCAHCHMLMWLSVPVVKLFRSSEEVVELKQQGQNSVLWPRKWDKSSLLRTPSWMQRSKVTFVPWVCHNTEWESGRETPRVGDISATCLWFVALAQPPASYCGTVLFTADVILYWSNLQRRFKHLNWGFCLCFHKTSCKAAAGSWILLWAESSLSCTSQVVSFGITVTPQSFSRLFSQSSLAFPHLCASLPLGKWR